MVRVICIRRVMFPAKAFSAIKRPQIQIKKSPDLMGAFMDAG
jgi:hypothetical protein